MRETLAKWALMGSFGARSATTGREDHIGDPQ